MAQKSVLVLIVSALLASCSDAGSSGAPSRPVTLTVATDRSVTEVDPRFLSVAVDSAQVVGAKFWNPSGETESGAGNTPVPPYDFANPKLRALARHLAPAYLRIGGSEADRVYYDMSGQAGGVPPRPYESVLTRAQWDGVADFARALDFSIVFTINAGPGPRDENRAWVDTNARELLTYTRDQGFPIAMWELGNEVNGFRVIHGFDFEIDGAQFAADTKKARALVDELAKGVLLSAPSSAYWPVTGEPLPVMKQFLDAGGGASIDVLTWHYYPMQSSRCALATRRATLDLLEDPAFYDELDRWAGELEGMRDQSGAKIPIWLGETGGAQCGGQPELSETFAGGFWWIDLLGRAARRGHRVVVRQTLSGSQYGLLDDITFDPRPDYFTSVLFHRLMGTRVLDVRSDDPKLRVHAHCATTGPGDVALSYAAIDAERAADLTIDLPGSAEHWALHADTKNAKVARLNGEKLELSASGELPPLGGRMLARGAQAITVRVEPWSYGFIVVRGANAAACK